MSEFTFGEGTSQTVELRFWQVVVEVAPKALNGHFNLSNGQKATFYYLLFTGGEVRMKILYICCEIHFRMNPESFVNRLDKCQHPRIFKGFVVNSFFENTHNTFGF